MNLVDTSVWLDLLRGRKTAASLELRQILQRNAACLAPVILQELLQGARSMEQLEVLRSHFMALSMLVPSTETYADAGAL